MKTLRFSILIATFGAAAWRDAAWDVAYPSTMNQAAHDVQVVHLPEGNLAQARNDAVARSGGDWLCFLDADDELEPGYLDAMEAELLHVRWGRPIVPPRLLAPAVRYVLSDAPLWQPAAIPNLGRWPEMNECVIGTLVERRVFARAGGFRDLPSLEDYDLWLRCVKLGAQIVHVPAAVYRVHQRAGSRNSDQSIYHQLRREHAEVFERRSRR